MRTTEITITVNSVGELPEELYAHLNQAMWDFPQEFEDWMIHADGVRKT